MDNLTTVVSPVGQVCPRCGTPLDGSGPEGLCTLCLLRSGLEELSLREPPPPTRQFGDYEVLEEIARGGMGVVCKARQRSLGRIVAVKMVLGGGFASVTELARFRSEAETAARLQHPNIVAIHEVGEHEGQPYFSMDFVAGQDLAKLAGNAPLAAARAAKYLRTIAEAVQYAHDRGVLHRDLKPSNVIIDELDQPRVTDFGLAKKLDDDANLTVTGQVLGSPSFMPPEQALGGRIAGPTSDVYSLGALLFHLLTGRPPFLAPTFAETLRLVSEAEPLSPRLLNRSVPKDLETICLKCLEKNPARRYSTARELALELGRFLAGKPIQARPISPVTRVWRWCARKPAMASALGLLLVVAVGSPVAAFRIERERKRAEQHLKQAEQATGREAQQRARAEQLAEENRVNLYAARIKVAEQSYKEGKIEHTLKVLNSLKPQAWEKDLRSFDWHYLRRLCENEGRTFGNHTGRMHAVAFSHEGRWLATAGDEEWIQVWNVESGKEVMQLRGYAGRIGAVVFTPDDQLVGAGADGIIRIWDPVNPHPVDSLSGSTNPIAALAISPSGDWLIAAEAVIPTGLGTIENAIAPTLRNAQIKVWQLRDRTLKYTVAANGNGTRALAFSPDSRTFVMGGLDQKIKLCEATSGRVLAVETNLGGEVFSLAYSPDGREIAAAVWYPFRQSGSVQVLNADSLRRDRVFNADVGSIMSVAISPDGTKLATAGDDRIVRLWDYVNVHPLASFHGHTNGVLSLAFSPNGKLLASTGWDKQAMVWNLEESPIRQRIQTRNVFSVAFSPDGRLIASAGRGVDLRDVRNGRIVRQLTEYSGRDIRAVFSPDGRTLAATGSDLAVHFWDTTTWEHWTPTAEDSDTGQKRTRLNADSHFAFSPDSRMLVMPGQDNVVRFWDARTGKLIHVLNHYTNYINAVGFTRDGKHLFLGTMQTAQFFDVWSLPVKRQTASFSEYAGILRVSHNGKWVASGSHRTGINLRDTKTFKLHANLDAHSSTIYGLAFSHDGKLLATSSWDYTVKLWHIASGQELLTIPSEMGVVWSVAFSPDDQALAFSSGSGDRGAGGVTIIRLAN